MTTAAEGESVVWTMFHYGIATDAASVLTPRIPPATLAPPELPPASSDDAEDDGDTRV